MNAEANFTARFSPVVARPEAFLDAKTGLMIAAEDIGDVHTHAEAEKVVRDFRGAGFSDWRLPTVDELNSLVDRGRHNPAADPALNLKSSWYWTSTDDVSDKASCAWAVNFLYGNVSFNYRSHRFRVRAVRSARQ